MLNDQQQEGGAASYVGWRAMSGCGPDHQLRQAAASYSHTNSCTGLPVKIYFCKKRRNVIYYY